MHKKLKEKVALITGASSGIGRETASLFAKEGAAVALLGRNLQSLELAAAEVKETADRVRVIPADVTDSQQCKSAFAQVMAHFGRLDILVNAAGIFRGGSLEATTKETWDELLRTNLDSIFQMMQLALPYLEATKGNIINVSSIAGLRAFANVLAYCVSKAAVDQLTRCTALELAPKGIRVNAVNPGVVITDLHRRGGMDEEAYSRFLEHSKSTHPLGRVGEPKDVAGAILYLASGDAGWITGVTLSVDGGRQLTCAR